LKLLTSSEHGSLIAAPTFSLPEKIGGDLTKNENCCFAGLQPELSPNALGFELHDHGGMQSHRRTALMVGSKDCASLVEANIATAPRIVKSGLAQHSEGHRASDNGDCSYDFVRLFLVPFNRHVVRQLSDTFSRQKAGQQNIRVRQVKLAYSHPVEQRLNLKAASLPIVEQGSKDGG
jgi:hypothetical protein